MAAVGRAVVAPVRQLAIRATPLSNIDGWFERILPRIVAAIRAGWLMARQDTDDWMRAHARAEGRAVVPELAEWIPERVVAAARVRGPVAFKEHITHGGSPQEARRIMARTLPAAAQRLAFAGERDTVMQTVDDSDAIVGWRRATDEDPCAFCALLASRGAVYLSESTAGFEAHDGDECLPEPLYTVEDEPQSVLDLQEQWRTATAGTGGKNAIRTWRRYWDGQKKDEG